MKPKQNSYSNFKKMILIFFIIVVTKAYAVDKQTIIIEEGLRLKPLTENVWMHISDINMEKWGRVSANGIVILADDQLFIIDTPWDDRQTRLLVHWFQMRLDIEEVHVIVGHYHQDNLGGLNWVIQNGIESYSIKRTQDICEMKGLPIPENTLSDIHKFDFQEMSIEVHFIGEGHTEDSICVYLPLQKILYGGCSVKSLRSRGLGNIADANIDEWPDTIREMKRRFPDVEVIIPGHGLEGNVSLLDHTLSLFKD